MDLIQKFGHLSKEHKKRSKSISSEESKDDNEDRHLDQRAFNYLLGNFGRSHNDHPDRRSSGAGNMARDIDEWRRSKKKPAASQEGASHEGAPDSQAQ
ncbi:hypothetical protein BDV26DRAFT_274812 [Aspergillus bertholletiae]|uniref:Uncharacterized protein n=1 Tax=Aspergillus bertholletiae TaxID=1226010 RepID=A0A5N7ATI2_9EURO|nr:hypothetical protein BDV26DRAFT_274812 [Aspergillus bertholletiae]